MKSTLQKILIPVVSSMIIAGTTVAQTQKTVMVNSDSKSDGKNETVRIKIVKNENGTTTVIDTVLTNATDADLSKYGIDLKNIPATPDVPGADGIPAVPNVPKVDGAPDVPCAPMRMKKIIIENDGSGPDTIIINQTMNCVDINKMTGDMDMEKMMKDLDMDKMMKDMDMGKMMNDADMQKMLKDMGVEMKEGDGKKVIIIKNDDSKSNDGKKESKTMKVIVKKVEVKDLSDADKKSQPRNVSGDNNLKADQLNFYPNPSNGKFNLTFSLKEKGTTTISVFDPEGKKVYTETLKDFSGEYNKGIDLSGSPKGIYFLNVSQGKSNLVKKIIIE